ncbi:hypothetical protein LCGC14_0080350 [marine sediment metagenome]|uniref:TonB-dependent receptor plug domain-containing protein n=1 Tax=marine sediment metagenome TaxID=412755 RepID=A0A0F9VMC4_9ZZZZ|nr:carboxypeptidase-like regulatory domain-containing protein [Maribacter sp.]HDZ04628.1 carboxypeptidase-like regulatory domain-containing protein [Maribacter sp.]HEA79127.1 carboxypeptidase-like regulatory domain-containing protein [Maribacter sp.]
MKTIFLLLTLIISIYAFGQENSSIQGNILDGELFNEPLLMANVSIENTAISTHTNFRGNFEFDDLTPGSYNVVVQFLGYETIELPVTVAPGETTNIQASLKALNITGLTAVKTK